MKMELQLKEFLRKQITTNEVGMAALFPLGESAIKYINKLDNGEVVECEIREIRNYQQLKMFWACCRLVADNARRAGFEECDTREKIAEYIKLRLGYVDYRLVVTDKTGKSHVHIKTRSISYARMTQEKWYDFFQAALLELEKISLSTKEEIQENSHNYDCDIVDDK